MNCGGREYWRLVVVNAGIYVWELCMVSTGMKETKGWQMGWRDSWPFREKKMPQEKIIFSVMALPLLRSLIYSVSWWFVNSDCSNGLSGKLGKLLKMGKWTSFSLFKQDYFCLCLISLGPGYNTFSFSVVKRTKVLKGKYFWNRLVEKFKVIAIKWKASKMHKLETGRKKLKWLKASWATWHLHSGYVNLNGMS